MIVALRVTIGLTVLSGMLLYGVKHKAGPFAGIRAETILELPSMHDRAFASKGGREWGHRGRLKDEREDWLEDAHEILAHIALALVTLHLGGVLTGAFRRGRTWL